MNPLTLAAMTAEPFRLWSLLAWQTGEMMFASARVIGYRTSPHLALHGSSARREVALMGTEKVAAASESLQAAAAGWMQLNQAFSANIYRQALAGWSAMASIAMSRTAGEFASRQVRLVNDTLGQSAAAASRLSSVSARGGQRILKPVRSRALANAKRLARR